MAVPNLTRDDARVRAALLEVESYDIDLDLTDGQGNPSEITFRARTTLRFSAQTSGRSTFLDVVAQSIESATLNGEPVDVSGYDPENGIVLENLALENTVVIESTMLYTNTGEGMHRFVDPVDSEVYLYTQFEASDAKRVYACFDQPDLKATFTFHVTAPQSWEVISNSPVTATTDDGSQKTVHFGTTVRISPYITAIVAGPYYHVHDTHDGIELGLYCRKGFAEYLEPEENFATTKQGFDWYHANFGVRYPFGKYDQLFVPEFNAGAMENAGCVTFNEIYLFRGKVTEARRERRGSTILHEMAHMWFGDLVTMRWFDDLWLNESFATYASALSQANGTRWTDAWTTFANVEKTWAYRQDQLPSTHPIAADAPDVQTAETNFDGITYAKGASVLKQLAAYVGVEDFLAALREYFTEHAYANTTLADLLRALEKTSGRDLGTWSTSWLETTGINTIRPEFTLDSAGHYASFELVQQAPTEVATTNVVRPHRLAIGLYNHDPATSTLVRTGRVELDLDAARTTVEELVGVSQPDLLMVNDDDLTYCKARLDERSVKTLRTGGIAELAESLPRALAWSSVWDMTRDAEVPARDYIALVVAGAAAETNIGLLQSITRQALRALEIYADPSWAPAGYQALAEESLRALNASEPGSDHQLAWVHAFLGSARSAEHAEIIKQLSTGAYVVEGLAIDNELRWSIVQALASRGLIDADGISAELERDPSDAGHRHADTARALIPTAEAKAAAWKIAVEDAGISNFVQKAAVAGFGTSIHSELLTGYVEKYFDVIADVWSSRSGELAQTAVVGLFPLWSSTATEATLATADAFLARTDLPAALRRLVSEGQADIVRALAARKTDTEAGTA
ncbi:membrane alanyl aminopeptidase [Jatrophihabitans sp. GAS493]|uniref:aminopeptidase N n=1 Tax=Jatrophihabitans sp. GAS493 TaxID=1907575 RepID=UPI000BB6E115|nr:aminopeptidase N [Jatrophihabitans sp. GAS493]SOD72847.1 membrane alanyl aminopeptidase [Jatrophihabitans sp. GAS493]